eukprot:4426673-Amphidinium_carterae.1
MCCSWVPVCQAAEDRNLQSDVVSRVRSKDLSGKERNDAPQSPKTIWCMQKCKFPLQPRAESC